VTRVLSGAVLLAFAVAVVWFAPPLLFLLVAEALLLLGCYEYAMLARGSGLTIPTPLVMLAAAMTCATFSVAAPRFVRFVPLDMMLILALILIGTASLRQWSGGRDAVASVAAGLFPLLYLGVPIGAMVATREVRDGAALFLLMITIVASDTAQYYSGRAFGRRPLAPAISPKKTIEGAIGGFVFAPVVMVVLGQWWLPETSIAGRVVLGVVVVALGIAGDLFESMLKRSAGVKDSGTLIPGHGGVLDRIDALLFAAPMYHLVLRYV
jgi:phosphatidate cytidylyltransferase